jgi:hypothetical protein
MAVNVADAAAVERLAADTVALFDVNLWGVVHGVHSFSNASRRASGRGAG